MDEKDDKKDKPEEKPEEKDPDKYDYKESTRKTLRQIGKEIGEKRTKKAEEEPKVEEKPEDKPEKEVPIKEPPKEPQVDVDAVAKKAADEAANKVAQETKKAFDDKVSEILNKDKTMVEKQQELDELIPIWEKENRLPKDYPELIAENLRVTQAKWAQLDREKQAKSEEERVAAEKVKVDQETQTKAQADKQLEDFNKQITQDLNDIYDAKFLPRPDKFDEVNNPDTSDKAAKKTQELLSFGVKLNIQRKSEGKDPITSLSKIYFLHYKPTMDKAAPKDEQPAGGDAPVAGAKNTPPSNPSKIDYNQLHNETWAQTKARIAREIYKKVVGK